MTGGGRRAGARSAAAGRFGRTWWGRAWVEALEQRAQLDPNRLPRGIAYAGSGTVGDLEIVPGEARATVGGRLRDPYDVRVRVRVFDDAQWTTVLDTIAARAAHAASLLEGQLPEAVAADVAAAGLSLLPGAGEIGPRCTCPDEADPCKHSAAVCYLVAEALDTDPFLVLLLRGRTEAEVLAGVRSRRRSADGGATDDGATDAAEVAASRDGPAAELADEGVDARAAFAAASAVPAPVFPAPPLPPGRPGRPAPLPLDPPPELGGLRADLATLAADAVRRAWELAAGTSRDGGLQLAEDADLARRAHEALGSTRFAQLASRCGVPERELARRALAWRNGGAGGLEVLRDGWDPSSRGTKEASALMESARDALRAASGTRVRVRRNRVTAAGLQLRLGRDHEWYPYRLVRRDWEPAGPPSPDPATAAGTLLRP